MPQAAYLRYNSYIPLQSRTTRDSTTSQFSLQGAPPDTPCFRTLENFHPHPTPPFLLFIPTNFPESNKVLPVTQNASPPPPL
ncbi:hypothetical protein CEXT_556961 [Caerostris extrusa]|uniref:Uncharacterized protein n=1 Tax=Caerostris extrusa TaxID=172846 RepID=A0AAV4NRB9_CAEEX|nr:hypothetical protein CEXT_556961 [Caerostris extrusa]